MKALFFCFYNRVSSENKYNCISHEDTFILGVHCADCVILAVGTILAKLEWGRENAPYVLPAITRSVLHLSPIYHICVTPTGVLFQYNQELSMIDRYHNFT